MFGTQLLYEPITLGEVYCLRNTAKTRSSLPPQVLMGDYSTEFRPVDSPLEHVGYCPQVNPLWPRITLQEHLEIYAAIKGIRAHEVPGIIDR